MRGTFGDDHCREWSGITAFNPAPSVQSFDLPSVRVEQYTANPTGSRDLTTATASADASRATGTTGAIGNARDPNTADLQASLAIAVDAQGASVASVSTGTAQRDAAGANTLAVGTLPATAPQTSSNRQSVRI